MPTDAALSPRERGAAAEAARACFHCGLRVRNVAFPVVVDGTQRETCCRGCQAVAQTIADNGLGAYHRNRSALPAVPDLSAGQDFAVYDLPVVQRTLVRDRQTGNHEREAALLLEGVTCAACVWLIEQRLERLPGVTGASANYAARRLRVSWDERETRLSAILAAIRNLGYAAQPYDTARSDDALRAERRKLLWRVFVSGFAMMQVMMYAVPAYMGDTTITADLDALLRVASLCLTVPVVTWAAMPFYVGAWRQLRGGQVGMDVPISVGILLAFGASLYATASQAGAVYYDSVSMFVFLLLGARLLELSARTRAAAAQDELVKLAPALAEKLDSFPASREPHSIASALLSAGDVVLVRPGAVVPADGVVVEGRSALDESLITGESRAVPKTAGDRLVGGARNKHSPLIMRVERVGAETVLSGIVQLMDRAQGERPRVAQSADRAARYFVAVLLALSVLAGTGWYVVDPSRALWIAVAVLVVSCPCALSLATPVALTAATGALHRSGVLVARGHALEALAQATHFVFDKTGTLTTGTMTLVDVVPLGAEGRETCLAYAAALERGSEHAIGRALVAAAEGVRSRQAIQVSNVQGQGIEGMLDGARMRIGTPAFVSALNGAPLPAELGSVPEDVSVAALGDEHGWFALFTFSETLRSDAKKLVQELVASGKQVVLLSGDREDRVRRIARELGIDMIRAAATPAAKVDYVRALQARGAVVAMTGDGVNDAPVLAQSHVSIAVCGGTDLAQLNADVILMRDQLSLVQHARKTAQRAMRVIRENIAWALIYNSAAVPLALAGYVTPLVAAAGMSLSSLAVVLNALRLVKDSRGAVVREREHLSILGRA